MLPNARFFSPRRRRAPLTYSARYEFRREENCAHPHYAFTLRERFGDTLEKVIMELYSGGSLTPAGPRPR